MKLRKAIPLEPVRSCGKCSACCTILAIDELGKNAGVPCPNLAEKGCTVYADRPEVCKGFQCMWLAGGLCKGNDTSTRPDRLGLMILRADNQTVHAFETRRRASYEEDARLAIEILSRSLLVVVIPHNLKGDRRVTGPPHLMNELQARLEAAAK